jgi:hypothetical protein
LSPKYLPLPQTYVSKVVSLIGDSLIEAFEKATVMLMRDELAV